MGSTFNISEVTPGTTWTTTNSGVPVDGWGKTLDLRNDTLSVSGNFDRVSLSNGNNQGDSGVTYSFSPNSAMNQYGTLTYNTSNGTWTFTVNPAAISGLPHGTEINVQFTVVGTRNGDSDDDTMTIKIITCMARGTLVETADGLVPVEDLGVGDMVVTKDGSLKPIRWIGSTAVPPRELERRPELRPIRIRKGALGDGLPVRDLVVSPQHRVLVAGWQAELFFGEEEVLVPAKALLNDHSITVDATPGGVEYFHLMLDEHDIILTEGAPTESFHPGDYTLSAIGEAVKAELAALDLLPGPIARPGVTVREGAVIRTRQ